MGVREALLQARVASPSHVDEALARQQLYGADIVTNLLELTELQEDAVQQALSEVYNLTPAPAGELPYGAGAALELVPRDVASELSIYPFRLDDGVLTLIASTPLSERATVDLTFSLKVQIRTLFSIAPRVKQAIARDYAFALDKRTARALALLERSARRSMNPTDAPPEMAAGRTLSQMPRPPSIAPFGFPSDWSDAAVTPTTSQLYAETAKQPAVQTRPEQETSDAPETSRSVLVPHPDLFEPTPAPGPTHPPSVAPRSSHRFESHRPPSRSSTPGRGPSRQRRRGPYTPDRARSDLLAASSGEEILETFFDFAAQYFDYAAAFALHSEWAELHDSRGTGASAFELQGERLMLHDYPVLGQVAASKKWLLCNLAEVDPSLATLLDRATGHQSLLLPVVVRQRCITILYGGFDTEPVELAAVGDLFAFAPLVVRAFEHAIRVRRARSSSSSEHQLKLNPLRPKFAAPTDEERARALAHALSQGGDSNR